MRIIAFWQSLCPHGLAHFTTCRSRLESVDLLRGLVMVLMALDHARDFFTNAHFDPLDLTQTTPALFMTRWITHFCAPVFTFLAGTGAYLALTRGKTKAELSWFLFTRGLWLALLEATWVRCLGWEFNFDFHSVGVGTLWSIGWSMVALSALVFLPTWAVTCFGVAMIAGHNALDWVKPEALGSFGRLWNVLHVSGSFQPAPGFRFAIGYPLVPWIGVVAAGYGIGALLMLEPDERRKWIFRLVHVRFLLRIDPSGLVEVELDRLRIGRLGRTRALACSDRRPRRPG